MLVVFETVPSLQCLEWDSLDCGIQLSATHLPLFSDLHPSLPDVVHGPFLMFFFICDLIGGRYDINIVYQINFKHNDPPRQKKPSEIKKLKTRLNFWSRSSQLFKIIRKHSKSFRTRGKKLKS